MTTLATTLPGGFTDYTQSALGESSSSRPPESPDDSGSDHGGSTALSEKKRRRSSAGGDDMPQRVQLACFWCRSKRIRCSGTKPICEACSKANVECQWPEGRRKKRTRAEMQEARRLAAEAERQAANGDKTPADAKPYDPGQLNTSQTQTPMQPPPLAHPQPLPQPQPQQLQLGNGSRPTPLGSLPPTAGMTMTQAPDLGIGNSTDAWNFGQQSNFVWPSGFTPPGQATTFLPDFTEATMAQFVSPSGTDMRLLNALESGAAYIEGDPSEDKDLELYYYRFSGSTAIHPGINRISLKLQRRQDNASSAPQPGADDSAAPSPSTQDLFDQSGLPHPHIYAPLFDLFFRRMSVHFPSISRQRMNERFESGTMSAFLACCMCALGARFADNARDSPTSAAAPFIAKAQELVIPLLHLPAYDVVTGLLLLAWASFGQNSESGLWQYSGMAFRMAIDLGIHENSEIYESAAHVIRTKLLFWSLFITDRIVAFATGRPASIPEDIIEIPLPEDKDFFPDPARNTPNDVAEGVEPIPFVQFVKLMIICGRISNVLNGRRGKPRTLVNSPEPLAEQLAELQVRLLQFVNSLPDQMKWSGDNFRHQEQRGHGGTFLALHLWANAVLALVYHPDLLKSPSGIETPLNQSMSRSVKLALGASRQICECMVFADLVAQTAYTSTPYVVQPLYVAAMALLHEIRSTEAASMDANGNVSSNANPTNMFLLSVSRQNFTAIMGAILKTEQFWAGVNYVSSILEKRSGYKRNIPKSRRTFISLPDKGLLRRFITDREHPHNVAPATETSLRESIAKSERSASQPGGPSPYWLADLMSRYTVENMSLQPADSFDLERLLAAGGQLTGAGSLGGSGFSPGISTGSTRGFGQNGLGR